MWWSLSHRPRTTLCRRDGGCTLVESEDAVAPVPMLAPEQAEPSAADHLRAAALLAARVHARGPAVAGAAAAAGVLQHLTAPSDPRRFQAWLLQGLYHRMAGAEARRDDGSDAVARAHDVRATSVLRLAATSPDRVTARRARIALVHLAAAVRA